MSHACHTLSTYKTNSVECAVMSFEHHQSERGPWCEIWPGGWQHCDNMWGKNPWHVTGSRAGLHDPSYSSNAAERGALKFLWPRPPVICVYLSTGRGKRSCLSLTFFRLVVPILAELPVVVLDELVVVVLLSPLAPLPLITGPVVLVAVETLVPQGKEVTGGQLLTTGHAHETLHRQTIS